MEWRLCARTKEFLVGSRRLCRMRLRRPLRSVLVLTLLLGSLLAVSALHGGGSPGPQLVQMAPPPTPVPPVNPLYFFHSQAAHITAVSILHVMSTAKPGVTREIDMDAVLRKDFVEWGVSPNPCWGKFHCIESGWRTHYEEVAPSNKYIQDRELVLIDSGASYANACSDVTRTFPAGSAFTPRQLAYYEMLLSALKKGEETAQVGVPLTDVEAAIREEMQRITHLRGLKAYSSTTGTYEYLEHFAPNHEFYHYVGWGDDVHDDAHLMGDPSKGLERGQVFALEPAIHIDNGREQLGLRIEDTYQVSKQGVVIRLSAACPREPSDIMRIRRQAIGPTMTGPIID
jgi:Xaa-Pro aminopeptidase